MRTARRLSPDNDRLYRALIVRVREAYVAPANYGHPAREVPAAMDIMVYGPYQSAAQAKGMVTRRESQWNGWTVDSAEVQVAEVVWQPLSAVVPPNKS